MSQLQPQFDVLRGVLARVAGDSKPRAVRSIRQFAEQELVLPSGPYQGQRFKVDRLPWFGHWFAGIDSGLWRRHLLTGLGQGGKTLAGSAIPVMWHLFEHRETVVYGAPSLEMANDKWRQDVLPLIEASRYRELLPDRGRGSKGGTVLSLQFTNGATLRFMSGSGRDKVRAGFTSRVVVITEVDGLDESGESSRETDRVSQLEARTAAFGDRGRIYLECTTSIDTGRTWRELKAGTDSRLALCCPHCAKLVTPEREHLTGWNDAKDSAEARERAYLACPSCGVAWTESDRAAANHNAKLVHRGQEITPDGTITGFLPKTTTLGFRFNAVNNLLVPMAYVAEQEFSAPRTTDPEAAERKLRQFFWALPTESETLTLSEMDSAAIVGRSIEIPRGRAPADTKQITIGIDIGKWLCHWVAISWRQDGTPHVLDYGRVDVPSDSMAEEVAILSALRRFRDEVCLVGWPSLNGVTLKPSIALVDSGHWESTVVAFCRESGAGFMPTKGFGIQQLGRRKILHEPGFEVVNVNGHRLVEISSDFWKTFVHQRIQTPVGQPGGLTLFHATPNEHLAFAKHLTAEKRVEEFISGRGVVIRWEAISRSNHFLDATALACVAGYGIGEGRIVQPQAPPSPRPSYREHVSPKEWMTPKKTW